MAERHLRYRGAFAPFGQYTVEVNFRVFSETQQYINSIQTCFILFIYLETVEKYILEE